MEGLHPNVFKVLGLRRQGYTRQDIGKLLDLELKEIDALTRAGLDYLRTTHKDVVEEAFLIHYERLEALYKLVNEKIEKLTEFDDKVFKIALLILERQSRLLALDRPPKKETLDALGSPHLASRTATSFLSPESTPAELIAEVESYGIVVPDRFKLPGISSTGTLMA